MHKIRHTCRWSILDQVRLGRPDAVRPELLQYCPDAREKVAGASKQEEFDARRCEIKAAQVAGCTMRCTV